MAKPHDVMDKDSIGPLLIPDTLSAWAWMFAYAAVAGSFLLVVRLQGMGQAMSRLAAQPGVPIGMNLVTYLYRWLGAGPVFLLLVVAIASLYMLVRTHAQDAGAAPASAHLLGLAALLSPATLSLVLGYPVPSAIVLPAVAGIGWATYRSNWSALLLFSFLLLLFSHVASVVLVLSAVASLVERKPRAAIFMAGMGLVVAPSLFFALGSSQIAAVLRGTSQLLTHPWWSLTSSDLLRLLWTVGPVAMSLWFSSGKRLVNAWWIPTVVVLVLSFGRPSVPMWNTVSSSALGLIFVTVGRSLAGERLIERAPRVIVLASLGLVALYAGLHHILL